MHPSFPLFVASPTAAVGLALLLGNGAFLDLGGEDYDAPLTAESLLEAVEESDEGKAEWLLRSGVEVDVVLKDGRTALIEAIDRQDPGMARVLLEWGADPAAVDEGGGSVLYHAIREGEVSVVKEVLDRGVRGFEKTPAGGSLFAYSVAEGRTASARLLLDSGASPKARCEHGRPVSFYASEREVDWLLAELLAGGADVNAKDGLGETVVHAAVRSGASRYLPLLWSHGADANATNRHGVAPMHLAIAGGELEMVGSLHDRGAELGMPHPEEGAPVMMALEREDVDMLGQLLELGADVESRAKDGRRAVEVALDRRDFAAAKMLAERGANLDGQLYEAVEGGDTELVFFLLKNGADVNPEGVESPLVAAVRGDQLEMASALLEAGAKAPGGKVCAGQRLFHLALARGHRQVVHELLRQGADVNEAFAEPVKDEFVEYVKSEGKIGWFLKKDRRVTPLMMAADSGDLEMVRLLMDYGAKTNTWTRRHRLWPVNFASRRSDVPMMQVMFGADPDNEERWVKVDLSEQTAWVYGKNNEVLLKTRVSTGKKGYRTPTGSFVVSNKYRHWNSTIYDGASMPYFQRLSCGDFGFHQGYVPNYPASHGCLRVPSGSAYKLYKATRVGDRVEIVE